MCRAKCFGVQSAYTWQCPESKRAGSASQGSKAKIEAGGLIQNEINKHVNGRTTFGSEKKTTRILNIYNMTSCFSRFCYGSHIV